MNKIERELIEKGWFGTQIRKDVSCGAWPEKHVRVTMWDARSPINLTKEGKAYGWEFADGDAATVSQAFENLKRNIAKGHSKFFPTSYDNPAGKDYKKWKASRRKKAKK